MPKLKIVKSKQSSNEVEGTELQPIDSFRATRKNRDLRVVNVTDDQHEHEITFLKNGKLLTIVVDNHIAWVEPETFRII